MALAATLVLAACEGADPPGAPEPAPRATGGTGPSPAAGATTPPAPTTPPEATAPPLPVLPHDADRAPGQAGLGVTDEPCPAAVNPGNGCIYLAALEDLGRGSLGRIGTASSESRRAFWQRVNEAGGIAGYDVDASTYTRDTAADPAAHVQAFTEIRSEVLAVASTQGLAATAALLPSLGETGMAAVAATATSDWAASEHVATVGSVACVDAANGVDHALGDGQQPVVVVHQPGTFGEDAAAGAALAAARRGSPFDAVTLPADAGGDADPRAVAEAVDRALGAEPAVIAVAAGAPALEQVLGRLGAAGFGGTVVALAAGWDERLAGRLPAGAGRLLVAGPLAPWGADTAGHAALRSALRAALADDLEPREAHVAGWARQYPLVAALEAAAAEGELTPGGVLRAVGAADGFDSEGMLPAGEPGGPPPAAHSVISSIDLDAPTGLAATTGHVAGPTARSLDLGEPCPRP